MEKEPIQPEEIEETPEVVEETSEETPKVDVDALAKQLEDAQAVIEQHRVDGLIRRADALGIQGLEGMLPFIDASKFNDDNFDELTAALKVAGLTRSPIHIGAQSNAGEQSNDKSTQLMLSEAAAKATRTGKPEDMAAFSALKQKLGGNN